MDYVNDLIERLNNYKEQYLQDVNFVRLRKLGVYEMTDYLDGIQEEYDGEVRSCVVSYIFSKLSKEEIQKVQSSVKFEVTLEDNNFYSVYDIT
jgi:hypothetical protein